MQLFYHPDISGEEKEIVFPKDESKHIVKVLRKKTGESLQITNGRGKIFATEITSENQNRCVARIQSSEDLPPLPYRLHLAVAPTKMNDRYEWFLEKATEIGISEITPVICDHSERKIVKNERFEKVLQSAMKQSLHAYLPKLNEPISFREFLEEGLQGQKYIAHCVESGEKQLLSKESLKNAEVVVLIGPEGDFSSEEIDLALRSGWKPVGLGKSRLRTETAAVVACHTVALANEG